MTTIVVVAASYLLGSLSFAVVTARLFGLPDPRSYGSGNPGATNVLRSGNKAAALVTLLGDALKGALAVWIAARVMGDSPQAEVATASSGLAAFIGHLYPVYFGFKGGKGVATALGILLAFDVLLGLGVLAVWLMLVLVTRYVSLASVVAAIAAVPIGVVLKVSSAMAIALSLMGLLIIWRHAGNLRRLRDGTESKVFSKKKTP